MDFSLENLIGEGVLGVFLTVGAFYVNSLRREFQLRINALEGKSDTADVAFGKRMEHVESRIDKMEDRFSEVAMQLAKLSGQLESMNDRIERLIDNIEILNRSYTNGRND